MNCIQNNRFVVYTCVSSGYDVLEKVSNKCEEIDFICFTDKPNKLPEGWTGVQYASPKSLKSNHYINRYHKFFPHHILNQYRYSLYVDANTDYSGGFLSLFDQFSEAGCSFGAFLHPNGRCLTEEKYACIEAKRMNLREQSVISDQVGHYQENGFDVSKLISANYILIRDHEAIGLDYVMSLWWSHIFKYSERDQMSLNYLVWKEGLSFVFLDELDGIDSSKIIRRNHRLNMFNGLQLKVVSMIKKVLSLQK